MTTTNASPEIVDVQARSDDRGIAIDQVGVCDLRYPVSVLEPDGGMQQTVATISMSVGLPHHFKGTHMSRFIEILNRHRGELTLRTLPSVLRDLEQQLDAEAAQIEIRFPYFLERVAPVSGSTGLLDYDCTFVASVNEGKDDFILGVEIPVASLCPCSKEISDYGAHNQRGRVHLRVRSRLNACGNPRLVWIEELVELAERAASSPLYPVLKRPDERHVTMQAYDNPRFVEDILRNVASSLMADDRLAWFVAKIVNHESIHNHDAFALLEWSR